MIILIADSWVSITDRLDNMISLSTNAKAVYCANSYEDGLILFKEMKPAVVLLSMNLPAHKSVDLLAAIKETGLQTCIIILFIQMSNATRDHCKSLGAEYFLDIHKEFEKIPAIINTLDGVNLQI